MARLSRSFDLPHLKAAVRSSKLGAQLFEWFNRMALPPDQLSVIREDFLGRAGQALPTWLTTTDLSSAGTPTMDFVASSAGGVWAMKFDTTNEVENIGLYQGDNLTWDITKDPILRVRVKIEPDVTGAGGDFAAGDKLVIGLASARNATLDSITAHAWFRFEGANHNILIEADDGTTDTDDKDTGIDWVDDTWMLLEIDATNRTNVRFKVDGVDVTTSHTFSLPATGNLQFFAEAQKAAAANFDHRVSFDFIEAAAVR